MQANEDGIQVPVDEAPAPVQSPRPEEKYFSEEEVQKIRQQEKGKMYKRLEDADTRVKTMEEQRVFNIINDDNMGDEEKLERFGKSFVKLTELTVDLIAGCITKIETPDGVTTDKAQIKDFINNTSKDVFEILSSHLQEMKTAIELKAKDVKCGECEKEYNLPITMDQANFFGVRSQR
jgi:hypothetical protein